MVLKFIEVEVKKSNKDICFAEATPFESGLTP
jgi:hypothetical protein